MFRSSPATSEGTCRGRALRRLHAPLGAGGRHRGDLGAPATSTPATSAPLTALLITGALTTLFAICSPASAAAQELAWGTEWKPAREQAERTLRPILLDFTASWCAPCRAMDQSFWPHPQVRTDVGLAERSFA